MATRHDGDRGMPSDGVGDVAVRTAQRAVETAERVAFWAAIGLPAVYVPVLATGVDTHLELSTVVGLWVLNVVAILGGQRTGTTSRPK